VGFWGFCQKHGSKTPVNFPKKAGLAWFGLVMLWLSSRTNPSMATPKKLVEIALIMTFKIHLNLFKLEFFSFVVLDILTSFLGLTMEDLIQEHNQGITKPNQAKKSLFGAIYRCF